MLGVIHVDSSAVETNKQECVTVQLGWADNDNGPKSASDTCVQIFLESCISVTGMYKDLVGPILQKVVRNIRK